METRRERMDRLRAAMGHTPAPAAGQPAAGASPDPLERDAARINFRLQVLAAHERALADMAELELVRRRELLRTRPADLPSLGGTTPSTQPSTPTSPGGPGEVGA